MPENQKEDDLEKWRIIFTKNVELVFTQKETAALIQVATAEKSFKAKVIIQK